MRHEHHRPRIVREKGLEPGHGLDVQVVGRLVEQEHIGLRDQRAGQKGAASPAAGQRVNDRVGREVEPLEHELDPLLEPPPVPFLERVLQPSELLERGLRSGCGDLDRRVVIRGRQVAEVSKPLRHHVEDGTVGRQRHVLHQPRDPQPRLAPDASRIGQLIAADDLEQRRFPRAVAADHAHPLPRLDLQAGIVEKREVAVGDRDVLERNQRHLGRLPANGREEHLAEVVRLARADALDPQQRVD